MDTKRRNTSIGIAVVVAVAALAIAAFVALAGIFGGLVFGGNADAPTDTGANSVAASSPDEGSSSSSGALQNGMGSQDSNGKLVVKFVDVGQGDASIVELPDGKTLLIDTAADGAPAVESQLAADGRETIDWLVATHPDSDHIGGLDEILHDVEVTSVWAPNATSSTRTYRRFLEAVDNAGLGIEQCKSRIRIASGGSDSSAYAIDLLWPPLDASYEDTNSYSAIVLVTFGQTSFLFTGDAPVEGEKIAIGSYSANNTSTHVDVLKVSHHGSASGTDDSFASSVSPEIAVISYGENEYGHPAQVVLDALQQAGATIYGTRVNGTVTVASDGSSVWATPQREGEVLAQSKRAGIKSRGLE